MIGMIMDCSSGRPGSVLLCSSTLCCWGYLSLSYGFSESVESSPICCQASHSMKLLPPLNNFLFLSKFLLDSMGKRKRNLPLQRSPQITPPEPELLQALQDLAVSKFMTNLFAKPIIFLPPTQRSVHTFKKNFQVLM